MKDDRICGPEHLRPVANGGLRCTSCWQYWDKRTAEHLIDEEFLAEVRSRPILILQPPEAM